MKEVRVVFEDKDYKRLEKLKKKWKLTWREFILTLNNFKKKKGDKK